MPEAAVAAACRAFPQLAPPYAAPLLELATAFVAACEVELASPEVSSVASASAFPRFVDAVSKLFSAAPRSTAPPPPPAASASVPKPGARVGRAAGASSAFALGKIVVAESVTTAAAATSVDDRGMGALRLLRRLLAGVLDPTPSDDRPTPRPPSPAEASPTPPADPPPAPLAAAASTPTPKQLRRMGSLLVAALAATQATTASPVLRKGGAAATECTQLLEDGLEGSAPFPQPLLLEAVSLLGARARAAGEPAAMGCWPPCISRAAALRFASSLLASDADAAVLRSAATFARQMGMVIDVDRLSRTASTGLVSRLVDLNQWQSAEAFAMAAQAEAQAEAAVEEGATAAAVAVPLSDLVSLALQRQKLDLSQKLASKLPALLPAPPPTADGERGAGATELAGLPALHAERASTLGRLISHGKIGLAVTFSGQDVQLRQHLLHVLLTAGKRRAARDVARRLGMERLEAELEARRRALFFLPTVSVRST